MSGRADQRTVILLGIELDLGPSHMAAARARVPIRVLGSLAVVNLRELLGQFHCDTVGPSTGPILDLAVVESRTLNDAVAVPGSAVRITVPRIAAATDRSGNHVDHFREIRNTSLITAACRHDQATAPGCISGVCVEWQCDRE